MFVRSQVMGLLCLSLLSPAFGCGEVIEEAQEDATRTLGQPLRSKLTKASTRYTRLEVDEVFELRDNRKDEGSTKDVQVCTIGGGEGIWHCTACIDSLHPYVASICIKYDCGDCASNCEMLDGSPLCSSN